MQIIRYIDDVPTALKGGVVALGNFDGLHRGHQAVIKTAQEIARDKSVATTVMTFEPHPRAFFQPGQASFRLSPFRIKCRQMRSMGVEFLYVQRFNAAFSGHTADDFINQFLVKGLDVSHVVIGYDYVFGNKRGGNADFLKQRGRDSGFDVTAVDEFRIDAKAQVSSTAIREFLAEGACLDAANLLGRYWEIAGRVQHGDKRGRQLGFPTANVPLGEHHHPREGVYAVRAGVDQGGETIWYDAVANFGRRPTFNKTDVLLEVHVFDFDGDLYNRNLRVGLIDFIRPEQKFDGLDALKTQLAKDCDAARAVLSERTFPPNPYHFVAMIE